MLRSQSRVIAYLCQKRGIDYQIVRMLLQSGKLYQDEHGNCAFSIFDLNGNLISAELHGTGDTRFKGQAAAKKGFGFELLHLFTSRQVRTVCYFESAIDLLSFYQIYRHRVLDDYLMISMGGLNPSIVHNYTQLYPNACHRLFIDRDEAGRKFAIEMQMFVKYPSDGKDWNEYLLKLTKEKNSVVGG